jgi:TonB family protein
MSNWTLLVNLSLKSSAVLALAWLVALVLGRRSAAARHLVWTAAWAVLLALPLLSTSLPNWPLPLANAVLSADPSVTFQATSVAGEAAATRAIHAAAPGVAGPAARGFDVRRAAVLVWMTGALLAFAHMLLAYAAVWRLRRRAVPSGVDHASLGVDGGIALLEAPQCIPMTAGILRPAIFLPAESRGWTVERIGLVIRHELAHIARGDAATQLIARTALSLHWWNPLAWVAWREFLKERERAADDMVLGSGACASDYAGHLLEVARSMQGLPVSATAGVAMARPSQLEGRLLAILDSRVKRAYPGRWAVAGTLLAALLLATPLAIVRAQSPQERKLPDDLAVAFRVASEQKSYEGIEDAAGSYEKLGKLSEAQKLREAALAIRKESGERSALYAEGLVKLGDLANRRGAFQEADDYYRRAIAVGDMPETVPALINLGLHALRVQDMATAKDYLQRARNSAKSGNSLGRAMTWLAYVEESDPVNNAEVESLYRSAISMEDIDSADQALTTEMLVRFLRNQSRDDEAAILADRANTIRKSVAAGLSPRMISQVGVTRVGGNVSAPKLLHKVEPSYSEDARFLKYQGSVLLRVVIDVDGLAKNITVARGIGVGLDERAVEAVSQWKFQPGQQSGTPIPVEAQIEVNFRLM